MPEDSYTIEPCAKLAGEPQTYMVLLRGVQIGPPWAPIDASGAAEYVFGTWDEARAFIAGRT